MALRLAVANHPLFAAHLAQRRHRSGPFEGDCGQRGGRACSSSTRVQAVAEAVDAPSSRPPQLAKETWPATAPCRLIKDSRAFLEEHR